MTESGRGDSSPIDPRLTRLLKRRSRWRWSLSTILIGAYLGFGVGGVYFPDAYGQPILGTSLPAGLAFGYVIIFVSIILSALYVRVANHLEAESAEESSGGD